MSSQFRSSRSLVGGWLGRSLAAALMLCLVSQLTACATSDASSILKIETPEADSDADVYVDGEYIGQVDQVSGSLRLAPGVHRLEVRKPGRFPVQKTVRVDVRETPEFISIPAELLADPR